MTHIAIRQREDGVYDLQLADDDQEALQVEDDLRTLVLGSLLTEARSDGVGGYWGDSYAEDHPMGSQIWSLARQKITAQTLAQLEMFARDSLAWLVDAGIVAQFEVTVERPVEYVNRVHMRVVLVRPDHPEPETVLLWRDL